MQNLGDIVSFGSTKGYCFLKILSIIVGSLFTELVMDVVKLGRQKVNLNDCVSIPTLFWGMNYAGAMDSKYSITKQLGRVTSITSHEHF